MYELYETTKAWATLQPRTSESQQADRSHLCLAIDKELQGVSFYDENLPWHHVSGKTYGTLIERNADVLEAAIGCTWEGANARLVLTSRGDFVERTVIPLPADGVVDLPVITLQEMEIELHVDEGDPARIHRAGITLRKALLRADVRQRTATQASFVSGGREYQSIWKRVEAQTLVAVC